MNIWVPNKSLIYPKRDAVIAGPSMRARGRFKLEVLNPDKTLKRSTGWFKNLITNGGLDCLNGVNNGLWFAVTCVGSGDTTPADTDTALVSLVASTTGLVSATDTVQSSSPYFGTATITWQFAQGAAAGNLSEIGVGPLTTALFSRALILDSSGNPTTITVLSNEFLNVTYALEMLVPLSDTTGNVTLSGTSYAYTIRSALAATASRAPGWEIGVTDPSYTDSALYAPSACVTAYPGAIGTITGVPAGAATAGCTSIANSSYTPGSYSQNSAPTWGITAGNVSGGIGALLLSWGGFDQAGGGTLNGGRGAFQIGFDTPIPKDNTKQLTLNLNYSWTRM